jgi:hypothetical protein
MNERIIELRKEAYNLVQMDLQTNERDEPVTEREHLKMVFDKFAELIVRECAKVADETQFKVVNYPVSIAIEEHFGVDR